MFLACYDAGAMKRFLWLLAPALLAQPRALTPADMPPGVEMTPNVVYATIGSRELHADLFLPQRREGPLPAVVYIHGGGWSGGNKAAFHRQAARMATKGFAGLCIEYRLSGEAQYPAAFDDSKAAVKWLKDHASKYGVVPSKIGAAGGSAGGHLVAMLGTARLVQAVAAFNPALDLVMFGKRVPDNAANSVSKFLGASYAEKPDLWAEASPTLHVTKDCPPFLFLHGTADRTVPYQQSIEMMNKLKAAGVRAELFSAEGAGHGFFNTLPWFEPALKRMEEFFTSVLK